MAGGGYKETSYDRAAAAGLAQQGAAATRIWEDYGRPEAQRAQQAKAKVGAFNSAILNFLGPQKGAAGNTGSQISPPPLAQPAAQQMVPWDSVSGTINTWKLAGVPVKWESPGAMYQNLQDQEWWNRYGADMTRQVQATPQVAAYLQQNAPADVLRKFGLQPVQTQTVFDTTPDRELDLARWGFGQRIEAPTLRETRADWSKLTPSIDPASVQTTGMSHLAAGARALNAPRTLSFQDVLPRAGRWVETPDAATVGRQYEDIVNAANLTRLDDAKNKTAAGAAGANAVRGLSGGTLGSTTDRAVDLWVNREAARMRADTLPQRLQLEQSLRGEQNALTAQRAGLLQALTAAENARLQQAFENQARKLEMEGDFIGAENARRLAQATLQSDLQQRAQSDFYRQLEAQQALDAAANQNAWARVGWQAQQNRQAQDEMMGLLNYLQADAQGTLNPWQSVSALGDYAQGMAGLASSIGNRATAAQQAQNSLWGSGLTGLGTVLGYWPFSRKK